MVMKKLFSLMLTISMVVSMTACGSASKPVTTETGEATTFEKLAEASDTKSEIAEQNDKEAEDVILEKLKEYGYDISKGYAEKAQENYIYPEYIQINNKVKTVYLDLSGMSDFSTGTRYLDSLAKMTNSINTFAMTDSATSAPSTGMIGTISGAVNDMVEGFAEGQSRTGYNDLSKELDGIADGPTVYQGEFNTSEYEGVEESNFLSTRTNPLSTFSADVDTASYTNIRAILRENVSGIIPTNDEDSSWVESYSYHVVEDIHDVRIEEMLNYFKFSSDTAETNDPFTVKTEMATTPWNSQTKLLAVNVKARDLDESENTGSNLVFLIDTSGSMNEVSKMPLVKQSINMLIDNLSENDTISIVTYSGDSALLIEGANAKNDAEKLHSIISELEPYGSTNGSGGIEAAYRVAAKYQKDHSNSRIIMCSDGDLNVGITSKDGLERLVENNRDKGIYLTILGFGLGNYKDNKMETLADKGNGNYYYIDSLKEGYKVLVENITSTLITLADDVKFQIEFNPEFIKAYRKIGYENRNLADTDFTDDTKDAGEIGYGHEVTIVYELVTSDSDMKIPETELKYQQSTATSNSSDWATISIRYKDHGEKESKLIEYTINNKNYSDEPTKDWSFISNVVGFGLLVNESKYIEDLTIDKLLESLNNMDLTDDDKVEFISIVELYNEYLQKMQIK